MRFLKVILSLTIIGTAYLGDYVVFKSKYSNSFEFRAFTDILVHGILGFLSSIIFFTHVHLNIQACALNVILCTLISSLIDVDHFIVARSLYLKDLMDLHYRGILHNTTFWILLSTILLWISYYKKKLNIFILSCMLILAFTSHHIRDGNRRGIWFYPFGSTPPINKNVYCFLIAVLPHLTAYFYLMAKGDFSKDVLVEYSMVV